MRYVRIILMLLTALMLVIFSVQNSDFATIEFLTWSSETSMALLLIISFLFGSFFTFLFMLPALFKKKKAKPVAQPAPPVQTQVPAEAPKDVTAANQDVP
ncbi:MAG: LapA family protein [Bacteroidota bacterium]